ncbi:MAG TPA: DUF4159 domain-containing protein [Gemmatimonadaceae bacterium]
MVAATGAVRNAAGSGSAGAPEEATVVAPVMARIAPGVGTPEEAEVVAPLITRIAVGGGIAAQGWQRWQRYEPNVPYDGRFTFARIRYTEYRSSGWAFDYPTMERHLMLMVQEITELKPHTTGSNIHRLDDPELLKYPIAYLSEPGYWYPSDSEVEGLRTYLAKGGFLIVDDFRLGEWVNFEEQMLRVLPDAQIVKLDVSHPIFDSFFRIESLDMKYPHDRWLDAVFLGIYENNDPNARLMVVINYNNDIGDYMEHSADGFWPVNISNDAYKLAMNYIMYGLTH